MLKVGRAIAHAIGRSLPTFPTVHCCLKEIYYDERTADCVS
jgi:hypothetical protein